MGDKTNKLGALKDTDTKAYLKRRAMLSGLTEADATSALAKQKLKPASKITDVLKKLLKKQS